MRKQNMISSPAPPSQPAQPRARHSLSGWTRISAVPEPPGVSQKRIRRRCCSEAAGGFTKAIPQPLLFHSPPGLAVPLLFHSQPGLAVWGSQPGLAPKQGEKLVQQPGLGVLAVAGGLRGGFGWTHMTAGPMLLRSESLECRGL